MAYTTIKKPSDYFNTKLYIGNDSNSHAITGVGHQPDLIWIKSRSNVLSHSLTDAVRGVGKNIKSDTTGAEFTNTNYVASFDSDGFTINNDGDINGLNRTYASWNWKANGAGSANTDGTISSTVSANTTSGFSIVSYTGNGTAGATVGHGLGVKPSMIIIKTRESAGNWIVFHGTQPATKYIELNNTGALGTSTAPFNDTEPTSSVFTLGTWSNTNDNGNGMIAYCFAEKQGFSKFGSYTGNGSTDGTFVYTGFKPAFILVKQSNSTASWTILDNKRDSFNVTEKRLFPDGADAEVVSANGNTDFLSNGVKMRIGHANINASGSTYIYMCFAAEPLVGDNPATAR